jgi:hypothetical protein
MKETVDEGWVKAYLPPVTTLTPCTLGTLVEDNGRFSEKHFFERWGVVEEGLWSGWKFFARPVGKILNHAVSRRKLCKENPEPCDELSHGSGFPS